MARQGLANTFGLPIEQVRVQAAPIGGAFGGKLMISEPLAAAAALKLQPPRADRLRPHARSSRPPTRRRAS